MLNYSILALLLLCLIGLPLLLYVVVMCFYSLLHLYFCNVLTPTCVPPNVPPNVPPTINNDKTATQKRGFFSPF